MQKKDSQLKLFSVSNGVQQIVGQVELDLDPYFGKTNEQVKFNLTTLAVAQSASITARISVIELTAQEYEISSKGQITNDIKF